jgi:hypothetical protein
MIGTYGQLEKCSSMGRWGEVDLPDVADSAVDDAVAAGGQTGVGAAGVFDFIGNIVGAAGDIIGGITGVKAAKENAAATIEATRNQLASSAIAYKSAALNAKLAPVLQAQQLQVKQAQTRALLSGVLVLGGGALILGLILSTRKRGKKKKK